VTLKDVTIRMPEQWVDDFWGWYLDGGGDQGFMESLSMHNENYDCEEHYSDWDKEQLLLIHSDKPIADKEKKL
jgi:hypothetical protein